MSDGSRSRTGCLTCRVRKKKCDELRQSNGSCKACHDRQLTCYGYSTPLPSWYTDAGSWVAAKQSEEAQQLRALADTRYKIRRKLGTKITSESTVHEAGETSLVEATSSRSSAGEYNSADRTPLPGLAQCLPCSVGVNTWQLVPGTVWWDRKMSHLDTDPRSPSDQDTKLLVQFLDVIHPITHTFFPLSSSHDRNWLLTYLTTDKAVYSAALSVSACFEHSLTQTPRLNEIGICPQVRDLQSVAVRELRNRIDDFAATEISEIEDCICRGVRMLDVVLQLINLEVFSMLQGDWEIHLRAGRVLLNQLENRATLKYTGFEIERTQAIAVVLQELPNSDIRKRNLAYSIANFVWMDVVATSTFGLTKGEVVVFDYLGLLQFDLVDMAYIMGVQNWILAEIVQIIRLEQWLLLQQDNQDSLAQAQIYALSQADQIDFRLAQGMVQPEATRLSQFQRDVRQVSIVWILAARILLQSLVMKQAGRHPRGSALVEECLGNIEQLPPRLFMRVNLPFTVSGCLSTNTAQHDRFRGIFGKIMQAAQPPGLTWKGLLVMEECWLLRRVRSDSSIGWREAMQSMKAHVLLL